MDKFLHSRFFRFLVCFVLVCAILINCSPIRAKAFVGLSSSALIALTYLMAAGVVIVPTSIAVANSIGKSLDDRIEVSGSPELWEAWKNLSEKYDNNVPEWDPNDFHNDLKSLLAKGLLTSISGMVVSAVIDGVVNGKVEEEDYSVIDGQTVEYEFFNSIVTVSSDLPVSLVGFRAEFPVENARNSWTQYVFAFSDERYVLTCTIDGKHSNVHTYLDSNSGVYYSRISVVSGQDGPYKMEGPFPVIDLVSTTDKFYDDCIAYGSALYLNDGKIDISVVPEIYVGDIPDQIQNGDKDEENLNLPPIDPTRLFDSPNTAYEQLLDIAQQLRDGTMTYQDYLNMVEVKDDPGTDPSEPSDPEETKPEEDEEDEEDEDLDKFSLDLRDYFPFCIPFDLIRFFEILVAPPQAPVFEWVVTDLSGKKYKVVVDCSCWDPLAEYFRDFQLFLFIVGLGFVTSKFIKW